MIHGVAWMWVRPAISDPNTRCLPSVTRNVPQCVHATVAVMGGSTGSAVLRMSMVQCPMTDRSMPAGGLVPNMRLSNGMINVIYLELVARRLPIQAFLLACGY